LDNETFPLDPDFIHFLDRRFPERCPDPRDTDREVWMKAGERRVVAWLLSLLRQQEENDVPSQGTQDRE
jgi:hypothetical protein